MTQPTRIIVADDSPFVRGLVADYLQSEPDFDVIATASDGDEVVDLVQRLKPNAITLDLEMPQRNGLQALEAIMQLRPTPCIMVSGVSRNAAETTLRAIHAGAVDFVLKYVPGKTVDPATLRHDVISKVRAAAQVQMVRSIADQRSVGELRSFDGNRSIPANDHTSPPLSDIVVIGASTGGPIAVRELLKELPHGFSTPIIVVQHIPEAFTKVLTAQIDRETPLNVRVPTHGERLEPATVYIAPGDRHLMISGDSKFCITNGPTVCGHRPSIDVCMQSVAHAFAGRVWGVLLTGMGEDGAAGLSFIRAKGGSTFAQNPASCVVDGMPQKAIQLGAVEEIDTPAGIGCRLAKAILHHKDSAALQPPSDLRSNLLNLPVAV